MRVIFKVSTFRNALLGAYGLAAIGGLTGATLDTPVLTVAGFAFGLLHMTWNLAALTGAAVDLARDLSALTGTTDYKANRALAQQARQDQARHGPTLH